MSSRALERLRVESSIACSYTASAFWSARETSDIRAAMPERSSSATTSPALTTVPSGTMLVIFIWYWLACWAFCGALIWTNLSARSSPEVVTMTLNWPCLTRATTAASCTAGFRASSHAVGVPTTMTARAMRNHRLRKRLIGVPLEGGVWYRDPGGLDAETGASVALPIQCGGQSEPGQHRAPGR